MVEKKKRERLYSITDVGISRTKQSFLEECDINRILAQYARTGLLTHVRERPGFYVDVSDMPDYRSALDAVKQAEDLFLRLPSKTRVRFNNDPALFLDFCNDPDSEAEMRDLGLLPPVEVPVVAEPVATPPPADKPVKGASDDQ